MTKRQRETTDEFLTLIGEIGVVLGMAAVFIIWAFV